MSIKFIGKYENKGDKLSMWHINRQDIFHVAVRIDFARERRKICFDNY